MIYQIQEGSVVLTGEWEDRSVNVLIPRACGGKGGNLVIARDSLPGGSSFAEYLLQQQKNLTKQLPDFQVHLDAPAMSGWRPVHNFEFTWTNQGKPMRQLMTVIGSGDSVLSLTATIPQGCKDALEILQTAMTSLRLDSPAAMGR